MKHTKFSIALLAAVIAVSGLFSSCNKKLKDDIKELDKQVEDLKAKNTALQNQQAQSSANIGKPVTVSSFTTKTSTDSSISASATFNFWTGSDDCYMQKQNDGTWYFDFTHTEYAYWGRDTEMWGYYNPTTKAVTQGGFYFTYYGYNQSSYDAEFRQDDSECSITFAVNTFDTTTGAIDIDVTASTTAASGYNIYSGKAMNVSVNAKSTLAVYIQ